VRCPDCGAFYEGRECPNDHTDDLADRQAEPQPTLPQVPYRQGEWVGYEVTIGADHLEEQIRVPAMVLGVSSGVARLACYVSDAGRVVYVDAALDDLLEPVNPLEGDSDGD
jgi:hypothetical protein